MRSRFAYKLLLLPALLAFTTAPMAGCAEAHPSPLKVLVAIGTQPGAQEGDFERDDVISAAGAKLDEPLLILINGNPRAHHRHGGTMLEINHWLQPGPNTITIRGRRSHPLHVKLGTHQHDRVRQIWVRKKIEVDDRDEVTLEFEVGPQQEMADHPLPRTFYPHHQIDRSDKDRLRRELTDWVMDFDRLLQQRDGERVARMVMAGQADWSPRFYDTSARRIQTVHDHVAARFGSETTRFTPIDPDSLRFEFGPGVVMVYAGFAQASPYQAVLTEAELDGEQTWLDALFLAPDDDGWMVWQLGDFRIRERLRR